MTYFGKFAVPRCPEMRHFWGQRKLLDLLGDVSRRVKCPKRGAVFLFRFETGVNNRIFNNWGGTCKSVNRLPEKTVRPLTGSDPCILHFTQGGARVPLADPGLLTLVP